MNKEECIVISDEEEETSNLVETNSNDEQPQAYNSNGVYMPEFVSVPSTSMPNMESEVDFSTTPAKLAPTGSSNFIEITKSDLKKSIRKNDLIIKIDGTLNPLNINAIMSVIKLYNFQNAGKFFFVKSSNPNEEINVNDLICPDTLSNITIPDQENCVPQDSQKLNVICKANKVKAVVNRKPHQVFTATTTRKIHERQNRKIDKPNEFHQNKQSKLRVKPIHELGKPSCQNSETAVRHVDNDHSYQNQISFRQNMQNKYNRIRVKSFDQIGITSHQNVESVLGSVDNDHANQNQININNSNGLYQNTQENCNNTIDQIGRTSHPMFQTALDNDNTQKDCYKIRLKPFSEISKPSHQVTETAVSTDQGQFSEWTQNNSNLQESQQLQIENFYQESEHDPNMSLLKVSKNQYRSINWNNNTEWNNNDDLEYARSPTNFNVFSVKTGNNSVLQDDRVNYKPIQQNSLNVHRFSSMSNYDKVGVQNAVKKPKSKMKSKLQSFYEKKYKLKEVTIAVSRLEVENYFATKRLKEDLSFSQEQTLPKINQIFIHDHNFASMKRYYCYKTPPNTQLYFVNKHNITTALYMKNFPQFAKAIKTNKIKVISESTYRKYQPTAEGKLMSSPHSSVTTRKTQKFCKFVSDFHRSLSIKQNPFLKYVKLDHNYSVTMI